MALERPVGFASILKRSRTGSGLTQETLSQLSGVSVHAISDLERGVYLAPHESTVSLLADALGLSGQQRDYFLNLARAGGRGPGLQQQVSDHRSWLGGGTPLIGRKPERETLERHLSGVGSQLLLLSGDPGIGKTRLLQEATQLAMARKMTVLWGGCERRSDQDPYSPLTQALEQLASRQTRSQIRPALRGANWLVRLLPGLHDVVQAPFLMGTLAPDQERRLVFDSVTRFLANCAGPSGVLLLLDDLQWAGNDALALLLTVMRSADSIPLRAIAAYRETDVEDTHPLSAALSDLAWAGIATVLPISELAESDAALLLQSLIGDEHGFDEQARRGIIERSDGVPFFLVSYAEGIRSGAHTKNAGGLLPWSLSQSIRQRISALPSGTQDLLAAMAVIGRRTSTGVLASVVGRIEEDILVALSPACRAGILEQGTDRMYQFSHDAIRDVVEADLEAPRRMLLHRRIAQTLEELPKRAPERTAGALASHFMGGDQIDRALPYALNAGEQAELVFAHGEAERRYRMALDLACVCGDIRCEAEASARLGLVLAEAGQRSEARTLFERACDKYRQLGDIDGEARTSAWMTGVLETVSDGIDRVGRMLKRMEGQSPSEGQARLQEVLAYLLSLEARDEEALASADRAARLAATIVDEQLLWRSQSHRGRALVELGRLKQGLDALEKVISDTRSAGDINEVSALEHAATGYVAQGSLGQAKYCYERALQLAAHYSSPLGLAHALGGFANFLVLVCKWDEVENCLKQLDEIAGAVDLQWERPVALGLLARGHVSLARGNWTDMAECIRASKSSFDRAGEANMLGSVLQLLCESDLLQGNGKPVLQRLEPVLDKQVLSARSMVSLLPLLAWAYLEDGDPSKAFDAADEGCAGAADAGMELYQCDALWVKGRSQSSQGRREEALVTLKTAAKLSRRLGYGRGEGRALLAQGLTELGRQDAVASRCHLEAAQSLFRHLRLHPYIVKTHEALLQLQSANEFEAASLNAEIQALD